MARGAADELGSERDLLNCSTWRSGGPALSHPEVTSFDFLDEILKKVGPRDLFPNLRSIVVTGHFRRTGTGDEQVPDVQSGPRHPGESHGDLRGVESVRATPYPGPERPTPAAWTLTANAPGYILACGARFFPTFRDLGGSGGCRDTISGPTGSKNRTRYFADQSDEPNSSGRSAPGRWAYLMGEVNILPLTAGSNSSCQAPCAGPHPPARSQASPGT